MFVTRLISGIVLVIVIVAAFFGGSTVMFFLSGILAMIALFELYKVQKMQSTPLAIAGYIAGLIYIGSAWVKYTDWAMLAIVAGFLLMMCVYVFSFPRYKASQVGYAFYAYFYAVVLMMFMYLIRNMSDGLYLIPLVFISAWGNDTCAYCVGMLIGKHKMSPKLSPKKSVEGFIGGVVGAALLGFLYALFLNKTTAVDASYVKYAIMCGAAGMFSVVGDLTASAIKRDFEIKDYGKLIPGHGGIMDRFDSILYTAPVVYFIALYVINR